MKSTENMITIYDEWLKWLEYEPLRQQQIRKAMNEVAKNLTLDELEEIIAYKKEKAIAELFKKIKTRQITEAEYAKVTNYMLYESLEGLMFSKLDKSELLAAKMEIMRHSHASEEELAQKILHERQQSVYGNLSMVEAFVLNMLTKELEKRKTSNVSLRR